MYIYLVESHKHLPYDVYVAHDNRSDQTKRKVNKKNICMKIYEE